MNLLTHTFNDWRHFVHLKEFDMRKMHMVLLIALLATMPAGIAAAQNALPKSMLLDRIPAGAVEVGEAMKTAKVGDEIVLRGRITDSSDVFVPNRAIFRLADEKAVPRCCLSNIGKPVSAGSSCGVPATMRATVQFLDDRGRIIQTGLNGKHNLGIAKEVFVVGVVQQADNDRILIINAKKLHVPEGNIPFEFILDEAPADVLNVIDAKKTSRQGDSIAIRGRVGGSARPFVDGRAVFTIVGHGPHACSDHDDDHCKTPWDYCCTSRDELRAHSATIQVVDENGTPIRTDIKGRRGIKELSDITIVGTVVSTDGGALIVKTSGIYLNSP
ncbi:MAG TPA: hypothetical protein PK400_03335 [Phycisphaerales bacterium]|nr:hypothetical protein [Phycisphaerales bacterium]HRQ76711.1 hypothetical protein [Phycisphaerales bacterium]